MTMYESASKLNSDLVNLFGSAEVSSFTKEQRNQILNIMIRFGAVAKYRCRSNAAYHNFIEACFKDIATIELVDAGDDFKIFVATIK